MIGAGASAPGKGLLSGEYAVLEGAPALVAAVDRRVTAVWSAESVQSTPEVDATLALARERFGELPAHLRVDVSNLKSGGLKLGLGSSAGAAVAAAGASYRHAGHDLADDRVLDDVFRCAFAGHARVAPEGSGVDVAASTYGGFLRFERGPEGPSVQRLRCPESLEIRLIWTGQPARTSNLLAKVHAFRDAHRARYAELMDELGTRATRFADAFERGSASDVVAAAGAYGESMEALGHATSAPIVEARLKATAELASQHGGSAKPCGAGGGDVAVAFFEERSAAEAFERACLVAELRPVEVEWGVPGVEAYP